MKQNAADDQYGTDGLISEADGGQLGERRGKRNMREIRDGENGLMMARARQSLSSAGKKAHKRQQSFELLRSKNRI